MSKFNNELVNEKSLYLLKHSTNPVNWLAWNKNSLKKAKKENKIIILSIGYSTCHWCHVMERESFKNKKIAEFMNDNFISIKVDREERPDIDNIYMEAIQKMGIQGGWPLNIFLMPDQKPFYGGTYFSPNNWMRILDNIKNISISEKNKIQESSEAFTNEIIHSNKSYETNKIFNVDTLVNEIRIKFDYEDGGMLKEPKFPMPSLWNSLLLQSQLYDDNEIYKHVIRTIDAILSGGIYDHIGGGISRYSVDKKWIVPHFEKMIYDNGLFLELLSNIYKISKNDRYKKIINLIINWLSDEMSDVDGGFYSAVDAESEGKEGKFYSWDKKELLNIFKNENSCLSNEIDLKNNFGDKIIITLSEKTDILSEKIRIKLNKERNKRIKPITDKKVICSWNSIVLIGIINAYQATKDITYLEKANKNITFIKDKLLNKNKLYRILGKKNYGYIDDYAFTIKAFILYYESTLDREYLNLARELVEYTISKFYNDKECFFSFSSSEHEKLISNNIQIFDNVIPSANSVMYHNLLLLGKIYDDVLYKSIFNDMGKKVKKYLNNFEFMHNWIYVDNMNHNKINEITINGTLNKEKLIKILSSYSPNKVLNIKKDTNNKNLKNKQSFILCRNKVCDEPIFDIKNLIKAIKIK